MKELIKQIRDLTGAGFSECKKAAEESSGNLENALEILKRKGIERAIRKSGNDVEHGSVILKSDAKGNVVAINFRSQTDFAVKSDKFCKFVEQEAITFLNSREDSLELTINNEKETYQDRLSFFISILGENIVLNAAKKWHKREGLKYVTYLHNKINMKFPDIALLGVVMAFNEEADQDMCIKIAKHVAASDSLVLSEDQITEEMIEKKLDIKDYVLLNQTFFYDDSLTVKEFMEKNNITVLDFNVFSS